MAFNGIGSFSISAGASIGVSISYQGNDKGAQWIMAHSIGPGFLQVSNASKERRIRVPNALDTIYWTTVTNVGSDFTIFNLQGGGNG